MIKVIKRPSFNKTKKLLQRRLDAKFLSILRTYGEKGVVALSRSTPVDTGETSASWSYLIVPTGDRSFRLSWSNSVMAGSVPLVILLQYGHGVNGGGYVPSKNFINPAIEPIFVELRSKLISEVL